MQEEFPGYGRWMWRRRLSQFPPRPGSFCARIARSIAQKQFGRISAPEATGKIIVEHTNINPNKAAHIGHLRNATLGDSFVRCLPLFGP